MLLHPATPFEARDRAMRVLVRRAQHQGGDWTVGLVGVLLPGLRAALAPMVRAYPAAAEDLEAEALVGLMEVLAAFEPTTERVASRLLWRAAQRARRRLAREQAEAGQFEVDAVVHDPEESTAHPEFVLGRAVVAEALTADEARLIGDTRLGGVSVAAWAKAEGERDGTVRMRRMRAERKLVEWISEEA
jgi:DNA-directed RNA polymerase specialized sigma24 family protein